MKTRMGHYQVELDTFETKIKSLSKSFSENIGSVVIKFTKKQILIYVNDEDDGSILEFINVLERDEHRVLKITTTSGDHSYTMRFEGIRMIGHEFEMGDAAETKKMMALSNILTVNYEPMVHKLGFSFEKVEKQ